MVSWFGAVLGMHSWSLSAEGLAVCLEAGVVVVASVLAPLVAMSVPAVRGGLVAATRLH